jgi:CHAT domain-containing protein
LYQEIGQYKKAEKYYLEAEKIDKEILGENHPDYTINLNNLALLYQEMGLFEKAEKYYLETEKIDKKILGENHPDYAIDLNNLAFLYQKMGQYKKAEIFYLKTIDIKAKSLGKNDLGYATSINNLASLYKRQKKYRAAKKLIIEAKDIRKNLLGENHPDYAVSLNNLAGIYNATEHYDKSEVLYIEALAIYKKKYGEIHPDIAAIYNNLANLYQDKKEYAKSKKYYLITKKMDEVLLGKNHPTYASGLSNLADLYLDMNELDSALHYCIASINANAITTNSININNLSTLVTQDFYSFNNLGPALRIIAKVFDTQYKNTNNKSLLKKQYELTQVVSQLNNKILNSLSTQSDKLRNIRRNCSFLDRGISAAFHLKERKYTEGAFSFAEANKSILLTDAIKGDRARNLGDLPDSLVIKEVELQELFLDIKQQQYGAETEQEKKELNETLAQTQLEIDEFIHSIKNKYPKYHALKYQNVIAKVDEIQNLLDDRTLLLEYFLSNDVIYLFAVQKNEIELFSIDVDKKSLAKKIQAFHKVLSSYSLLVNSREISYQRYTQLAYWFYTNILAIALKDKDIDNLIIITAGELGHLPFETFLVENSSQKMDFTNLYYLMNDYNISYNYSATLWKENKKKKVSKHNNQLLAYAATYSDQDSSLLKLRLPKEFETRARLQPLDAAQAEVKVLSDNFNGNFLFGNNASESSFKNQAAQYGVIHLAMHGVLDSRNPMLSSLVFTENRDSSENNFLQAYEISRLNLNADLVVLSACETGYGEFKQGEGIISLARSFMYGGASSLVVSLWQVNDMSTAIIMKSFYQNLTDGMNKDEALRQAKLQYIKSAKGITAHPVFWSPFIQLGDTKAIQFSRKGNLWVWSIGGLLVLLLTGGLLLKKRYNV